MFATRARIVPDIAFASRLSSAGAKLSVPLSFATVTSGLAACVTVPSGPFTVMTSPLRATSAPCGSVIGLLPTRDMFLLLFGLGDVAEDFAADAGLARLAVGHHTLGRRYDCNSETVHHDRNVVATAVHAQTRLRHAFYALDHRTARV